MNGPQNGRDEQSASGTPQSHELSGRLERLDAALQRTRAEKESREGQAARGRADASGFAQAIRLSTELVAGVVVGGGLGWFFDYGLGTSPFGLIVFLLLGFCAGLLNLARAAGIVSARKRKP